MIGPLGMQEMLIILVVALIVFGPRKLPQIGKTLGKSIAEFRRTSTELRSTLEREVQMEEFRAARSEVSEFKSDLKKDVTDLGRGLDPDRGSAPAAAGPDRTEDGPAVESGAESPPAASGADEAADKATDPGAEPASAGEPATGNDAASDGGATASESRGDSGK